MKQYPTVSRSTRLTDKSGLYVGIRVSENVTDSKPIFTGVQDSSPLVIPFDSDDKSMYTRLTCARQTCERLANIGKDRRYRAMTAAINDAACHMVTMSCATKDWVGHTSALVKDLEKLYHKACMTRSWDIESMEGFRRCAREAAVLG